jgi:serine phosphatase RsbU (regulator of sigma subunit)
MKAGAIIRPLLFLAAILVILWLSLDFTGLLTLSDTHTIPLLLRLALLALAMLVALWLFVRGLRRSLWRVGRRLAFSYFLIGVVPIPIVALMGGLIAYLGAGFFLGHVYRDNISAVRSELRRAAQLRLATLSPASSATPADNAHFTYAFYRQGHKVDGTALAPDTWPSWLDAVDSTAGESRTDSTVNVVGSPFVELSNGRPAIVATAGDGRRGVLALYGGSIEDALSRRSGIWIQLLRSDDPRKESTLHLSIGNRTFALMPTLRSQESSLRRHFFNLNEQKPAWPDRPWLWWGELTKEYRALDGGRPVADYLAASLNGTPRAVAGQLFSGSAEVDTAIWVMLLSLTGTLGSIYLLAVAVAAFLIVGLSRAVNRLSRATEAIREGDFSIRIPVRRRDQLGELQRTFNDMAANLESSVAVAAHQEALESELAIARNLQQSLIPEAIPTTENLEFSTLFEPSAAIGGDYFDILRLDGDRLAVVIADVSGHGLPTGLRMAMLKAALNILVEENKGPEEILHRLDAMVRAEHQRYFVTCTIAVVDFRQGRIELTNAGHPPTYLIRQGETTEILLPGAPLGALGNRYGRREVGLQSGDCVVWLSDGLIEASNERDEPFGYERLEATLAGAADSAHEVRDRLLGAVKRHAGGRQADDDRTLVVMRYRGERDASP